MAVDHNRDANDDENADWLDDHFKHYCTHERDVAQGKPPENVVKKASGDDDK